MQADLHHGLIRLILEVLVPKFVKFRSHLLQFGLSWANLTGGVLAQYLKPVKETFTLNPASMAFEESLAFSGLISHSWKSYGTISYVSRLLEISFHLFADFWVAAKESIQSWALFGYAEN